MGSVSIWMAGWMFICRCCYRKQKWIFREQNDTLGSHRQLKDYSEKGEVEITENGTEKEVTSEEEECQCHAEEPQMSQNKNKMGDSYFT